MEESYLKLDTRPVIEIHQNKKPIPNVWACFECGYEVELSAKQNFLRFSAFGVHFRAKK